MNRQLWLGQLVYVDGDWSILDGGIAQEKPSGIEF